MLEPSILISLSLEVDRLTSVLDASLRQVTRYGSIECISDYITTALPRI